LITPPRPLGCREISSTDQIVSNSLHKVFRNSDDLSGFLGQYRLHPAIVILLTGLKKSMQAL